MRARLSSALRTTQVPFEREVRVGVVASHEAGYDKRSVRLLNQRRSLFLAAQISQRKTPISEAGVQSTRRGRVFITPKGTKGGWHVRETIVKFYATYAS